MKQLQILNVVIIATGAAMGLVLAAECIIYSFYLASTPRLQAEFRALVVLTAAFWALAGAGAAAWFGHRGQRPWRWLTQPLPLIPIVGIAAFFAAGP